ncbi:MAG: hypothetical protein ABEI58_01825, partial [Candidatus Nanohaloarchaea archaeon]
MRDPWKYVAFPAAAVIGYLISLGLTGQVQSFLGLSKFLSRIVVIALSGLFAGFMVDEVIPAYLEKVRARRGGGGGDFGGGDFGGDGGGFDDGDMDFG